MNIKQRFSLWLHWCHCEPICRLAAAAASECHFATCFPGTQVHCCLAFCGAISSWFRLSGNIVLNFQAALLLASRAADMSHQQRIQGAWGPGPPLPPRFLQLMQFSGNFKGKSPILSKFWAQGPPLGVKIPLGPP